MKRKVFGRKVGSGSQYALLIDSEGAMTSNSKAVQGELAEFEIANTRRIVQIFRDKNVEGYVEFEGDPLRYEFSPETDFIYPAVTDYLKNVVARYHENLAAVKNWRERRGYVGKGGVVVVFEGDVQSWVNELRNPDDWQPGCVAIDEQGKSWTAIGGDPYVGALMWLPNDEVTS